MSAVPMTPTPFGKYLLMERIAAGGMAEVYRAVLRGAAGFEKSLALKRILPIFSEEHDFVTLFQDEARIASTLNHANLVQVFDFGQENGSYYLALELVEGTDLSRLCDKLRAAGQPFPTATAAFVVAEAARGLAYAHDKRGSDGQPLGIVHRDVSPQNILMSYAGEVKVADFGIAKAASKVHRTSTGMVMGKLRYMSPEQVAGESLDPRSDVFSLGVVLYELLTGGPLFPDAKGSSVAEMIHIAHFPPPSERAPGVPRELDEIVMRALGRPRERRYPRAADLARDLSMWVNQSAPWFTREDLANLVLRISPPNAIVVSPAPAAAPSLEIVPTPAPTPTPLPASAQTPNLRAPTSEPQPVTPTPRRSISFDPAADPRAATELRQLDVATRTAAPESTLTGAAEPPRVPSRTDVPARKAKGGPSLATLVSLGLLAVIVVSGAMVILRFLWPASDTPAATPAVVLDAAPPVVVVDAAVPADAERAIEGQFPADLDFKLTATLSDGPAKSKLAEQVADRRVTRKGVPDADYELFLEAIDASLVRLTLDGAGKPEAWAPLPDELASRVRARGLDGPIADVLGYVAQTGELPPAVHAAALRYLRGRASFSDGRDGKKLAVATLAVWLDRSPARLLELARQNWFLGRLCAPLAPPRRRFAALACEPMELASAVGEAGEPGDADSIAEWSKAGEAADVKVTWIGVEEVRVELPGAPTDAVLLVGGSGPPLAPTGMINPDGGLPALVWRFPAGGFAPRIRFGDRVVRLPAP